MLLVLGIDDGDQVIGIARNPAAILWWAGPFPWTKPFSSNVLPVYRTQALAMREPSL